MNIKNLIPVVSVVLFAASMVGLLALQGRLNYEGTRGVPIVGMLFSKGVDQDANKEASLGAQRGTGKDGDHAAPAAGPGPDPAHGEGENGERPANDTAGDGGKAAPGKDGTDQGQGGPPPGDAKDAGGHEDQKHHDGQGKAEEPQGQPAKVPETFLYPPVPGRMTAEEIMAAGVQIEAKRRRLDQARAQLLFERETLAVRERDVEDRRKQVRNDMALVQGKSDELEQRIKEFESQTALLKRQEQKNFKEQAEKLALMDPKKASEYLVEFGPDGEDRAVKLLSSMDAESASRILEAMDPKRGARLLDRGLKLVREGG